MERIIFKFLSGTVSLKAIIAFGATSFVLAVVSQNILTIEFLLDKLNSIRALVDQFKLAAVCLYIFVYSTVVVFSVPVASLLTIVGGYVFGMFLGASIAFTGALIGVSILFALIKGGLKLNLEERLRSNQILGKLSAEIYENQFRYLLFIRFFPIFPFWVVNLAPAILGVKFRVFFVTTLIGIIPGTFIIAGIGEELRIVDEPSTELVYELISNPKLLFFFLTLSLISIFPSLLRVLRLQKAKKDKRP